jgi:hypothetical protein
MRKVDDVDCLMSFLGCKVFLTESNMLGRPILWKLTAVQLMDPCRLVHPAPGVPETLIQEMFRHGPGVSREGLGLHISQKLVKTMSGTVQYLREAESSSFIVLVEFPVAQLNSKRPRPSTSKSIF